MSKLDRLRKKDKTIDRLEEAIEKFDMETKTHQNLEILSIESTKENIEAAIESIKGDKKLDEKNKEIILDKLRLEYIEMFNFDNCPVEYQELKKEAKFLAGITQYSFLLMAQRLKKIKDGELYKVDGYGDFKEFIEKEINISRGTAYKYIDIFTYFGVSLGRHDEEDIEYTKLVPVIPLMKSTNIQDDEKESIKNKFISELKEKSKNEMETEAKELKMKYGIINKSNERRLLEQIKRQTNKLSNVEIEELIEYLKSRK